MADAVSFYKELKIDNAGSSTTREAQQHGLIFSSKMSAEQFIIVIDV